MDRPTRRAADAPPHDAAFEKYASRGAYHWDQVGRNIRLHHAFTAERYRRALRAVGDLGGRRVLDYGCGDGALLGEIVKRVGDGEAHGCDPNPEARSLARKTLARHGLRATIHDDADAIPTAYFDRVVCADVLEHATDPESVLAQIHRALKPGGQAVLTTPVRLSEVPLDSNHVREWFPDELAELLAAGPLDLVRHECAIPIAAAEVYEWKPPFFFGLGLFRIVCNVVSIHFERDALSWLRLPDRRPMLQLAVVVRR